MTTKSENKPLVPRVLYPLDPSGTLESNFIKDEMHTVSMHTDRDVKIIIPMAAPFFTNDFEVFLVSRMSNERRKLIEGVDFKFVLEYVGATVRLGKPVYGGIAFDNLCLDGVLALNYRTLGGNQVLDTKRVLKEMLEYNYNPRTNTWEYITDTPCLYNPTDHDLDLKDVVGMDELVAAIHLIANNIAIGYGELAKQIEDFLNKFDFCKFEKLMNDLLEHSFLDLLERMQILEDMMRRLWDLINMDKILDLIEKLEMYPVQDLLDRMDKIEKELEELKKNFNVDGIMEAIAALEERVTILEDKIKGLNKSDIEYLSTVVAALVEHHCSFVDGYSGPPVKLKNILADIEYLKQKV